MLNINQLKEMEKFKGTPKPWVIDRNHPDGTIIEVRNNSHDNYMMMCLFNAKDEETQKANALLISKAPEMLEMLAKVLEINTHHGFNGHMVNERIQDLIKSATEL